ncbi:MAG TPA: MDR family MFS transporter [Pseudonocardia sp.]
MAHPRAEQADPPGTTPGARVVTREPSTPRPAPRRPTPAPPDRTPPEGPAPSRPAAADGPARWGLPLVVLIVGMFMSVLDTSIINVAVPVIQKQFSVTTDDIQWVSTSYSLCEGVVVPASAWLGERFGLRRLYLWALVLFSAFSALCGMAGDLNSMVLFRILQAIPGGVLPVTCLTILYRIVPREKLGAAMGLFGLGIVVAPGIGPTLGGYLVEYVGWRLIFYINVPIGILGAIAAMVVLPRFPSAQVHRFDLPGFLCVAGGLFALLLALSEGQAWGWTSYPVLILVAAGVNLLVLFVIVELQTEHPLLDVRVFLSWPFTNSLLLIAMMSVGLFAVLFYIPLFLQNGQGLTPWHTGLVLLPQALVMMVLMPIAGRLYDRFGPRWPAVIGMALTGTGTLLLTQINIDMNRGDLILWQMLFAGGLGLGMMPMMTGGIASLPNEIVNSGSAFNTVVQRVSAALGLAALTGVSTTQQAQLMADRSALLQANGVDLDQRVLAMQQQGPGGLTPLWQQLQIHVQAQAYSDVFLIAGLCTLAGSLLAFTLRSGPVTGDGNATPVH